MSMQTLQRTAAYAGLARDALRVKTASTQDVEQHARAHLCQRMGRLKGLPQKLGQLLSFTSNEEKQSLSETYSSLQESAEPIPWKAVRTELEHAWEVDPETILTDADHVGRAASLGQVHRARLHDGREVAVKVQYPGIRKAIETDLKALGWLSLPVGNLKRGFNLEGYRDVFRSHLDQELSYALEAASQESLSRLFAANRGIVVPEVISSLSCDTVLVSSWEEGEHWDAVQQTWSAQQKQELAELLLKTFMECLFQHGLIQADWHPGNFRFRRTSEGVQVVMYDFGCMCQPTQEQRLCLARLIDATIRGSESPWSLMVALGFDEAFLEPLEAKLPAVCRVLFEPLCAPHAFHMSEWDLKEKMSAILGEDRWNFRFAGPPEMIFLMRAFHGLSFYLQGLDVTAKWQRPFRDATQALQPEMKNLNLPSTCRRTGFDSISKHLHVRVLQAGRTKVKLTQPATNVERLHELLDDDLRRRIRKAGIDLPKIVHNIRQRAYSPGPVFELSENEKQVEVWLE